MTVHEDLLVADFQQSYAQMRHYDDVFRTTLEFSFGGIVVVIGGAAALVSQFETGPLVMTLVGLLFLVAGTMGFLMVVSLARNRVYFAFTARYVNELRSLYLNSSPGGAKNKSKYYTDYSRPRIFSPGSSHAIQLYFLVICNSLLLSGGTGFLARPETLTPSINLANFLSAISVDSFLFALVQLAWLLGYSWWKDKGGGANQVVLGSKSEPPK